MAAGEGFAKLRTAVEKLNNSNLSGIDSLKDERDSEKARANEEKRKKEAAESSLKEAREQLSGKEAELTAVHGELDRVNSLLAALDTEAGQVAEAIEQACQSLTEKLS